VQAFAQTIDWTRPQRSSASVDINADHALEWPFPLESSNGSGGGKAIFAIVGGR